MTSFMGVELKNKIFMTGVIGSGKTTLGKNVAKANSLKYIDLDLVFDYESIYNQSKKILEWLPEEFLIDGIPPNEKEDGKRTWDDFSSYESKNNVTIICVYCSDKGEWIERIKSRIKGRDNGERSFIKRYFYKLKRKGIRFYISCRNIKNTNDLNTEMRKLFKTDVKKDMDLEDMYRELHHEFINCFFPLLGKYKEVKYYDSNRNEFTTDRVMLQRIKKSLGEE